MVLQEQKINNHLFNFFADKIYHLVNVEMYKEIKIKYSGLCKIIDIIEVSLIGENKELQLQYFYINHDTSRLFAKLKDKHSCISEECRSITRNSSKFIENLQPKSMFSEIDLSIINNIYRLVTEFLQSFDITDFESNKYDGKIEILYNFLDRNADFRLLTQYKQNKKFIFEYRELTHDNLFDECFNALSNLKNNNKTLLKDLYLHINNSKNYEFKNEYSNKSVRLIFLDDLFEKIFELFNFYKKNIQNNQKRFQNKNFLMVLDLDDREKFLFTFYDTLYETVIKDDIKLTFKITDH